MQGAHQKSMTEIRNEPRREKTGLRDFCLDPTQTSLYNHTRWLEASNFVYRKKRDCTIRVVKTKALISFAATAKLICVLVFAYAKSRFSHDEAQIVFKFRKDKKYDSIDVSRLV